MHIDVLTRWTNGRIREYAICLHGGDYLTDASGRIVRFHQKAAAIVCLTLLQGDKENP